MFFDARTAKLLQPGQHLVVEGCQGLRLVATATRKTWTYRYKATDGRMKQLALGQWPDMPASTAAAKWQSQRDARAAGTDPRQAHKDAKTPTRKTGPLLVRQVVQDYIDGHLVVSRAVDGAQAAQNKLLSILDTHPDFAAMQPSDVTRGVAFDLIDNMKATPTAAAKARSMLGAAWDYALDAGRIPDDVPNWWRMVHKGRLKSKGKVIGGKNVGRLRRVLSDTELSTLLQWMHHMHPLGFDMLTMYLWTGTRGSEIASMSADQVTTEGQQLWWTIPKVASKNARYEDAVDHRVPLLGRALQVAQRRLDAVGQSGWLFERGKGKPYSQHAFSTYVYSLQPYSSKAKGRASTGGLVCPITHWTPHHLRHTVRTLLAALGCPKEVGEAIIGHKPPLIEDTYNAYTYDAERIKWLKRLDQKLERLAGSRSHGA